MGLLRRAISGKGCLPGTAAGDYCFLPSKQVRQGGVIQLVLPVMLTHMPQNYLEKIQA